MSIKKSPKETQSSDAESEHDRSSHFHYGTPGFMSAVMRRQLLQEMVKMLPANVQSRIRSLKNIQLEQLKLEAEFYDEVYKMEKRYHIKYQELFDKRGQLVNGEVEPSPNEEPKWKVEPEDEDLNEKMKEITLKLQKNMKPNYPDDVKGVPDFWLTIFRNTEILSEMIQEHDEPLLKKLRDIKISYGEEDKNPSYTVEFYFDKNEYFSNTVLTKQYFLKSNVDEEYPFSFEGPEIFKCKGCQIDWEKSMNLTIKTIRKKQKHKERGAVRTVTKQVPNDSFFNFFCPPEIPEDKNDIDEESQSILATDFEIGHFLRARIVPKAVLYYTGDIVEDDEDEDYDEEDEEEDDDEEDDDETDGDGSQQKQIVGKKKPTPNECPNQ